MIREYAAGDYPAVGEIYRLGILSGNATFETAVPGREEWEKKFLPGLRLVAVHNGVVLGWAGLTASSSRCVYAGVCEVSVYIHPEVQGKGWGKILLQALIDRSEQHNIWMLEAGIFPENEASLKLHEHLGFRQVGVREKLGKMDGRWRDVVLLERRSKVAGV